MDNLKNVLSKRSKLYKLFCLPALLLCVCTEVPEFCGDGYPSLNPSTEFCGNDGRPHPKSGYAVTVNGGTGGGSYVFDTKVSITAGTAPYGQVFKNWTTTSAGVTFANANSASTSFTMPGNAVTVTAVFEAIKYAVTVSGGTGATGSGSYAAGTIVSITAGTAPSGQRFKNWTTTSSGVNFANANNAATSFTMPSNAATVTAVFEAITYAVTVTSAGTGATGSGNYAAGATVSITAGTAPSGQRFRYWTTSSSGVTFANANSATTTFTMPSNAVTVTAVFEAITYAVTVSGGTGATGSGNYAAGATVSISAGTAPSGQAFKNWTTSSSGVTFANANNASTSFTMPSNAVTVTANFEAAKYTVTVSGGSGAMGTGSYAAGATVSISAGSAPSGQVFKNWTTGSAGVTFANANSAATSFVMPSNAVTVTAVFEQYHYDVSCGDRPCRTVPMPDGKTWMAENLNVVTVDSWCNNNSADNCVKYGRLYTWSAAKLACQSVGWRLPDTADWRRLVEVTGGDTAAKNLKSTSGWENNANGTDEYGFLALPGGGRSPSGGSFGTIGNYGAWWTATEDSGGNAYYRYMAYAFDRVNEYSYLVGSGYSVRCVADE